MRDRNYTPFGSVRLQPDKTRTTVRLKADTTEVFKVNPFLESRRMLSGAAGARLDGYSVQMSNCDLRVSVPSIASLMANGPTEPPLVSRINPGP